MTTNTHGENTYTTKEAAEIIGVKERAIQTRCKKDNVRKRGNKYLITDSLISFWKQKEEEANATVNANATQTKSNALLDIAVKNLTKENESLKEQLQEQPTQNNTQLDLEVESLKERIKELEEELQQYDIEDNERIEVFTDDQYSLFETRLNEWHTLQTKIEHQEELFDAKLKSSEQIAEHYLNQFKYQKEQSTRILEVHEKLILAIETQNKIALQRSTIEAVEKDIIQPDTWKRKG